MPYPFLSYALRLVALTLLLAGSGCQVVHPRTGSPDNTNSYCVPPQRFGGTTSGPSAGPLDTTALPQLSARGQQLAHAYGLTPALRRLLQPLPASHEPTPAAYRAFVRQRQALALQVVQASAEAVRVAEELQCEKQRADQAAVAVQAQQTKQTRNFTLASLLAGAASGTVSATVRNPSEANLNLVLTVGTAAISAGFGIVTLFVNPQLDYPLPDNLLADVWYQRPQPTYYSAGLWASLNEVPVGRPDLHIPPPLAHLRQRWARYDQLTKGKPAQQTQQQALYFGSGGRYHLADLQVRSGMLAQLEVAVRAVNQDLQKLLVEVSSAESP